MPFSKRSTEAFWNVLECAFAGLVFCSFIGVLLTAETQYALLTAEKFGRERSGTVRTEVQEVRFVERHWIREKD